MKRVEALKAIQEQIASVIEIESGPTGYLDQPVKPTSSASKGIDAHGRVFIALCVHSREETAFGTEHRVGVLTVFQRYSSNDSDVVTQATNHGRPPALFQTGVATAIDMVLLEELAVAGDTKMTFVDIHDVPRVLHIELCTPEEAMRDATPNASHHAVA